MTDAQRPNDCPLELWDAITEFWPTNEWLNAADVARLESAYSAFAVRDTRRSGFPCGSVLSTTNGVAIAAELSVGYFQINVCNLPPEWEWQRLYNARHNAGTAHWLWAQRGWNPWFFSAGTLGLIS